MSKLVQQIADIARNAQNPQHTCSYGELETYYPDTHSGIFRLPEHPETADPTGQTPSRVGPIPIGSFFGGAGYGAQFPPPLNAQALLIYIDPERILPVCAVFLFNKSDDPAPYPDGKTWGFKDRHGSEVKITDGGVNLTDGNGGVRVVGAAYGSFVAPLVELGAEGLDATLDAVCTVRQMRTYVDAIFNAHVHTGVQTGAGVTGTSSTTMNSQGSTTVRAKA